MSGSNFAVLMHQNIYYGEKLPCSWPTTNGSFYVGSAPTPTDSSGWRNCIPQTQTPWLSVWAHFYIWQAPLKLAKKSILLSNVDNSGSRWWAHNWSSLSWKALCPRLIRQPPAWVLAISTAAGHPSVSPQRKSEVRRLPQTDYAWKRILPFLLTISGYQARSEQDKSGFVRHQ